MRRVLNYIPVAIVVLMPLVMQGRTVAEESVVYMYLENTTNRQVYYQVEFHPAHNFRQTGTLNANQGILLIKRNADRGAPREVVVYIDGKQSQARLKWYQDDIDPQQGRFFNRWAVEPQGNSTALIYKSSNTDN